MEAFEDLLNRWCDAEARGDTAALGMLLDAEFRGDGPLGYVLGKQEWLDRYGRGDLVTDAFAWRTTEVRVNNQIAICFGVQSQCARYRGKDWSGDFVCTLVAVRRDDRWAIVNIQTRPPG